MRGPSDWSAGRARALRRLHVAAQPVSASERAPTAQLRRTRSVRRSGRRSSTTGGPRRCGPSCKATLVFLEKLTLRPGRARARRTPTTVRAAGVSDQALRDAATVCALFSMIVRLADSFGWDVPELGTAHAPRPAGARRRLRPRRRAQASVGGFESTWAIRSAMAAVVRLVFARGMVGMIDASDTISPSTPSTRPAGSTTAPIAHVPAGWK